VTISLHALAVETYVPMLSDLSHLLDKGAEFARTKGFDPDNLVNSRLAPDSSGRKRNEARREGRTPLVVWPALGRRVCQPHASTLTTGHAGG